MKTILITGINGYLGSCIAKELSVSYHIIGLEFSDDNLFRLAGYDFKVYAVEHGFPAQVFSDQQIDIIIHCATFYGRNDEEISKMAYANLFVPFNMLDSAIKAGCKLFINTDTVLNRYISTYSLTKRHFQEWLYMRRNQIKVVNMQLEHFYGPGCSNTNFITNMIEKMCRNEPLINLTMGEQLRDFIFVDDVISAYKVILDRIDQIEVSYSNFQVCTNNFVVLKDVLDTIKTLTKSNSKLIFGAIPYRENEIMKSESDNLPLMNLGWAPKFTLEEGLLITLKKGY